MAYPSKFPSTLNTTRTIEEEHSNLFFFGVLGRFDHSHFFFFFKNKILRKKRKEGRKKKG